MLRRPGFAPPGKKKAVTFVHISTRVAAETLGTAVLVVGGVGTAVLAPDVGPVGIALAFGVSLLVLVYVVGPISGCHLNPAVTLAMFLRGRIAAAHAGLYVVGQLVGGVVGAGVVLAVAANRDGYSLAADGLGTNGWGEASTGGVPPRRHADRRGRADRPARLHRPDRGR